MEQLTHLTQKYIEHHFPSGEWIWVYTDGSATEAVRNGGGGVYIEWPDGTSESHAIPTGLFSSNYRAEIAALKEAASILKNHSKTSKNRRTQNLSSSTHVSQVPAYRAAPCNPLPTSFHSPHSGPVDTRSQ